MNIKTHRPQQALYRSHRGERYRELLISESYSFKPYHAIVPIRYIGALMKYIYMPQSSTGLVSISYIGALLRTLMK
jgi:hypothetical protein